MAKRHRTRARTHRAVDTARRSPAPHPEPRETREAPAATAAPVRRETRRPGVRTTRGGFARAVGTPSVSLERAAVLERGFVVKDFRRVGIVVAIAIALLIASGVLESVLLH